MHRHLTVSTLLPCWASVKTIRFKNPEYRLQKWNLLSLTSSSTEKENARHFYSIPYQLRANRRILRRADSMNYSLEKFAKGLKHTIVRLNVDCRMCDLGDSLNPPLPPCRYGPDLGEGADSSNLKILWEGELMPTHSWLRDHTNRRVKTWRKVAYKTIRFLRVFTYKIVRKCGTTL